jgi:hypothetical protein
MSDESFEILVIRFEAGKKRTYRMQAEIIYRSEQVIRFKISAGTKYMIMEKLLMKHKGQWKIKETNFALERSPKENAMAILEIQNNLDDYLDDPPTRRFR